MQSTRLWIALVALCLLASAQIQDIDPSTPASAVPGIVNDNFAYVEPRLVEYGTTLPGACTVGQVFFDTDAPAGQNLYGCTASNTWTLQASAGGSVSVEDGDGAVGTVPTLRFTVGNGLVLMVTEIGGAVVDINYAIDTAVMLTRAQAQSGEDLLCEAHSNDDAAYTCSMSPPLSDYSAGMVLHFVPDVTNAASGVTLAVDSLDPRAIKEPDCVTDLDAAALTAGTMYPIWYNGTAFCLQAAPVTGAGGSVTSVGLSMPSPEFSVSNSPVTSNGTLTVTRAAQPEGTFLAVATGGGPAVPQFRAITPDDLPPARISKGATLEAPTNAEHFPIFYTDVAITLKKIYAEVTGSGSPSLTWTLRYGTACWGETGTEVATGGTTTTTASTVTTFDSDAIPANSCVWLGTTASTDVDVVHLTIVAEED